MTVLAGDIGGTNARLAIHDAGPNGTVGASLFEKTYPSRAYPSLDVIVDEFAAAATAKIGDAAKVGRWPSASGSPGSPWSTTSMPPRWASPRSAPPSW